MGFYDYADYNSLSDDQKLIWWFDEYITSDLVYSFDERGYDSFDGLGYYNHAVIVERYSLYNYPWAEGYSTYLYNLVKDNFSDNLSDIDNKDYVINISNIPDGETVIVSYLEEVKNYFSSLTRLDTANSDKDTKSKVIYTMLQKHFHFFTAKNNGGKIPISIARYSAVITGNGVTIGSADVANPENPETALYSNINSWQYPPRDFILRYRYSSGKEMTEDLEPFLVNVRGTNIIYAKPPSTLFGGIYNRQITSRQNLSNNNIPFSDLQKLFYKFKPKEESKLNVLNYYDYHGHELTSPIPFSDYIFTEGYSYEEANLMFTSRILQGAYEMGEYQMIQEIHACLGAGEFAYYSDGGDKPVPYKMNIARKLDWFAKAYGVAFNPDGSIISVRGRVNVPYKGGTAKMPDGYARGQYADRVNKEGKETMGIAYQNRCNIYENLSDDNSGNDVLKNGDIVLCENFLQLFESYLEDLDKGLNWQEMGGGLVPNADGTSYTTFEGMGTLLAEVAYTLSALSSNIQQTHVLALKNNAIIMEVLKGLGLPVGVGTLPVGIGGESGAGGGGSATVVFPQLSANAVSLHKRMMDVLATVSLMAGSSLGTVEEENNGI